jgi:hypothetical protein
LEQNGLSPGAATDRRTLIRRVTFDVTGLPPTPEEVAAFSQDTSPDAYLRLIERLLASPQYGERWARHWLDVARYSDTKGYTFTEERRLPYAYTYRDWVVRSLNAHLPYDQFLVQQIAADRLPLNDDKRPLAALGFLTLGRRFLNNQNDIIDDRIDVVSRGTLGLSVGCARCHDHKFDPIPTADYYSLYGVFASTEEQTLPIEPPSPEFTAELEKLQREVDAYLAQAHGEITADLRSHVPEYLLSVHESHGDRRFADFKLIEHPEQIYRPALNRWHDYLTRAKRQFHPVLSIWFTLSELPADDFQNGALRVAAEHASTDFAKDAAGKRQPRRSNSLFVQALLHESPQNIQAAARVLGKLLTEADNQWQQAVKDAQAAGQAPPTKLGHVDLEELRQVIHAADSPASPALAGIRGQINTEQQKKLVKLDNKITAWRASPGAPACAMAMTDRPSPVEPHIFLRGNSGNAGPPVKRQFLACIAGDNRQPFNQGSGRLELAQAIASRQNPLTARVLVNRVWGHYFGAGLVRTPSDFGVRCESPSHPELLDTLAADFMDAGWSLKWLHRSILLSRAYQQSAEDRPDCRQKDPENRLLWKMNRRRLEWEALRDSLLAVSGELDRTVGGQSVEIAKEPFSNRRTIYGLIDRQNLPGIFRAFDLASPDAHTPQRFTTTVPQQSLYLMNHPFAVAQAQKLIARADVAGLSDPPARIARLYQLLFGRDPSPEERELGLKFVTPPPVAPADDAVQPAANVPAAPAPPPVVPVAELPGQLDQWQRYAQGLLLTNEFLYID